MLLTASGQQKWKVKKVHLLKYCTSVQCKGTAAFTWLNCEIFYFSFTTFYSFIYVVAVEQVT